MEKGLVQRVLEEGGKVEFGFYLPLFYSHRIDLMRDFCKSRSPRKPAPTRSALVRAILGGVLELSEEEIWLLVSQTEGDLQKLANTLRAAISKAIKGNHEPDHQKDEGTVLSPMR